MGVLALYHDSGYLRLWVAQALSVVGTQASLVALPLLVLGELHSPSDVGLTTLAEALATVAMLPGAGLLIDRLGYRTVMLACDLLRCVAFAVLGWLVAAHQAGLVLVVGVAIVNSALGVVFSAANSASFRLVVPAERLAAALSLNQGRFAMLSIVGPVVGAACYARSPALPFLVDAVSFLLSAGCVRTLRLAAPEKTASRKVRLGDLLSGWRFLWDARLLRYLAFNATTVNFAFGGVVLVLLVVFSDQGRAAQVGAVLAVGGLANLAGSVVILPTIRRVTARALVLSVTGILAVAVLLLPLALDDLIWICLLIGLGCVGTPAVQTLAQTALLRTVPADLAGRAQLVYQVVPQLSAATGPLAAAFLLTRISAAGVFLVFGGLLAGLALVSVRTAALHTDFRSTDDRNEKGEQR